MLGRTESGLPNEELNSHVPSFVVQPCFNKITNANSLSNSLESMNTYKDRIHQDSNDGEEAFEVW